MEVYDDDLNSYIRKKMQSHGWTLKPVEPVEEEEWDNDRIWHEIEVYENDDNHDDINNDSDFWRRAADGRRLSVFLSVNISKENELGGLILRNRSKAKGSFNPKSERRQMHLQR